MSKKQQEDNSIAENITGARIATGIMMVKKLKPNIAFLIVEGQTDMALYSNFIEKTRCEIRNANTKNKAKECLAQLERNHIKGVLAIVDLDWDYYFVDEKVESPNLFYTDTHDMETMLIKESGALEKVVNKYVYKDNNANKNEQVREQIIQQFKDIRTKLINCTYQISLAFIISKEKELDFRFNFKLQQYSNFIDQKFKQLDIDKFIDILFSNQKPDTKNKISIDEFKQNLKEMKNKNQHTPWLVCRGHDMTSILALFINTVLKKSLNKGNIEDDLCLYYEYTFFKDTDLYQSVIQWEKQSPGYKVFR